MAAISEDSIKADIREKFMMNYYSEARRTDTGMAARLVRWGDKHAKKIALGFASALAVAFLPMAAVSLLTVAPVIVEAATAFSMLTSTFTLLGALGTGMFFAAVDGRVAKKGLKSLEQDIDNGSLVDTYIKTVLPQKVQTVASLSGALDALLEKSKASGAFNEAVKPQESPASVDPAPEPPAPEKTTPAP